MFWGKPKQVMIHYHDGQNTKLHQLFIFNSKSTTSTIAISKTPN